jgi:hypothetical protein
VSGDRGRADRSTFPDHEPQEPPPLRRGTDARPFVVGESRSQEVAQRLLVRREHAERGIAGSDNFTPPVDDLLEYRPEVVLGRDGEASGEESLESVANPLGCIDRLAQGYP